MDPNAIFQCLTETLKDLQKWPDSKECRAHAIDCLEVLATWLRRGGFPPDVLKHCAQMITQEVLNNPLFKEE